MIAHSGRKSEIYIDSKIKRKLFKILEVEKDTVKDATIESVAERLINFAIEQQYPNMPTLLKRLDALDYQLTMELLNPTVEK